MHLTIEPPNTLSKHWQNWGKKTGSSIIVKDFNSLLSIWIENRQKRNKEIDIGKHNRPNRTNSHIQNTPPNGSSVGFWGSFSSWLVDDCLMLCPHRVPLLHTGEREITGLSPLLRTRVVSDEGSYPYNLLSYSHLCGLTSRNSHFRT
jgi:hypothetical protein